MDTKIIKQYGEDMLCYDLRNARQKKRKRYADFDKQLIQLHKKEKALYVQKRNLGWQPLHPPVQKGWVRYFVVRDDVAKSKYGEFCISKEQSRMESDDRYGRATLPYFVTVI